MVFILDAVELNLRREISIAEPDLELMFVLAESYFNKKFRTLKMIETVDVVASSTFVTLPTDFLEIRSVVVLGDPNGVVEFRERNELEELKRSGEVGSPKFYTISSESEALRLEFHPTPLLNTVIQIVYYQKIPTILVEDVGFQQPILTNWLLEDHFEIYLYGVLVQAGIIYEESEERLARWTALFDQAVRDLNAQDDRGKYPGGQFISKVDATIS